MIILIAIAVFDLFLLAATFWSTRRRSARMRTIARLPVDNLPHAL